jgi:hypothetical protein
VTSVPSSTYAKNSIWLRYRGLALLLLFTLTLRGGLLIARYEQLNADPDDYSLIAHNIVQFATFSVDDPSHIAGSRGAPRPSAFRPPLYPILLSNLAEGENRSIPLRNIALLHVGLGLATVWLTWGIARAVGLQGSAYIAGLLVACDPILLNQQSLVMTETLAAFCTALAWALLVRFHFDRNWWNAALAGAAIGLAALCRPTYLPWLLLCTLVALLLPPGKPNHDVKLPHRTINPSRRWALQGLNAVAMLVGGLGTISPWVVRNYQAFQRPLATTTHGGYTLYLANNPHFYHYLRTDQTGMPWDPLTRRPWGSQNQFRVSFRDERHGFLNPTTGTPLTNVTVNRDNEFQVDALQSSLGWQSIANDPAGFLVAAAYRVRQLWSPLPYRLSANESPARTALRFLTAAWYLVVYAAALLGIYSLRTRLCQSPWLWGMLLCLLFTGVHLFYWCNLRMRAPLMPIVAVVAAAGIHRAVLARASEVTSPPATP